MKAACTLAAAVWCAGASAQADPAAVLLRGRERIHEAVGSLSKYTCTQTVDRSYFRQQGRRGAGCDEIVANKNRGRFRLDLTATDRLRLDVAVADSGVEIYSWPNAGRIGARKVEDLAAGGPIGTGSFGGFLRDVFENPGAEVAYDKAEPLEGQTLLRYRFRVPLKASHYGVQGGAVYSRTAYGGAFWLDPASGDLRRLMVRTGELAPNTGVCEATTQVDLTYSRIGAGDYLVPRGSLLHTVGRYGSETESAATYSACREYHGDSVVHFDAGEAARGTGYVSTPRTGQPLPPGLPVVLALEDAIDTGTAAAGDPIAARILADVVEMPSTRVLAAAGSTVRGRITHMEHHVEGRSYFLVTLTWETLEAGGVVSPFRAILDRPLRILDPNKPNPCSENVQQVESHEKWEGGGTLVLPSRGGRYVTPRGCESDWLTIR